jgi:hypothetical protein
LSSTPVPINIDFVPVDPAGNPVGSGYEYPLKTDLVGPPPPTGVSIADGDTLFIVNWNANVDPDTAGYDVFLDPIPGQEGQEASVPVPQPTEICPDTGAATGDDASLQDATSQDATLDASVADASAATTDAGCHFTTIGGSGDSGSSTCYSPILASGIFLDSGTSTVVETDDSGEGGTVVTGGGGISTIPCANVFGADACGSQAVTVSDKSTGTYTIKGLKNGPMYNVAVAATDGYGNVGPPSTIVCDSPAPVNDFWDSYRGAGGRAGGGFCALEAVGAPGSSLAGLALVASAGALARRRRRRSP